MTMVVVRRQESCGVRLEKNVSTRPKPSAKIVLVRLQAWSPANARCIRMNHVVPSNLNVTIVEADFVIVWINKYKIL